MGKVPGGGCLSLTLSLFSFTPLPGGTPLYGHCGYVPLERLWFFDLSVLNRVYNFVGSLS